MADRQAVAFPADTFGLYREPMSLISDSQSLAAFCARLESAEFITVDTEFLRDNTYWPKLCLVQVAGPDDVAAIDTLAEGLDLAPLLELMSNPKLLKVFHSARQDLEIFYHLMGDLPVPLFDTQVAAMVCGFGDQVGYETLVRRLTGAQLDKSSRFTDWSKRPLTDRQMNYALSDVTHLRPIYETLRGQVEANGRAAWLEEEMTLLTTPATYALDPQQAWLRLKTRSRDRRYLAVLRALAAWRERQAQKRNIPRGRFLRDEQLYDIAAHTPKTVEELARTRGLSRGFAEGRQGVMVLEVIAKAVAQPKADWPVLPNKNDLPNGLGPVVDLLKVLLAMKCQKHSVAQRLVATTSDLEQIAADDQAKVPALRGWRRELFGEDALALKHGKLALGSDGEHIVLIPQIDDRKT